MRVKREDVLQGKAHHQYTHLQSGGVQKTDIPFMRIYVITGVLDRLSLGVMQRTRYAT